MREFRKSRFKIFICSVVSILFFGLIIVPLTRYPQHEVSKQELVLKKKQTTSERKEPVHQKFSYGRLVALDEGPKKPPGTIEQLKIELEKHLSKPIKLSVSEKRDIKEKELGIKVSLTKRDISEIRNEEVKQIIFDVMSSLREVNFQDFNFLKISIDCLLTHKGNINSETNVITIHYAQPVVIALPWHEVDHLLWYGMSDKLNIHPALQSKLVDD